MDVALITVPYFLGRERVGMGWGPERLLEQGASSALREDGHAVDVSLVHADGPFRHELGAAFEIDRRVAASVREAVAGGRTPLLLLGGCDTALGVLAGLSGTRPLGVVWFDAHADFNTPETSASGFFGGMALSAASGGSWRTLTRTIPGFEPIAEERVVLVGARDVDPGEEVLLSRSSVARVPVDDLRSDGRDAMTAALDALRVGVEDVYVHIDLDVLDPAEGVANEYAAPDGPSSSEIEAAIGLVRERFTIAAAALAAYNPRFDPGRTVAAAGLRFLRALAAPSGGAATLRS